IIRLFGEDSMKTKLPTSVSLVSVLTLLVIMHGGIHASGIWPAEDPSTQTVAPLNHKLPETKAEGSSITSSATTGPPLSREYIYLGGRLLAEVDPAGIASVGVYRNGIWFLRNTNSSGPHDVTFGFGMSTDVPVVGDWDGDGVATVGVFRDGSWLLRNTNSTGNPDLTMALGGPGDIPVVGDWNGDGIDTVGVYRNGIWYLRDSNTTGAPDLTIGFGAPGDIPVVGDWNGDGVDTIGVFRQGGWLLRNSNTSGDPDLITALGTAGDIPV